MVETADYQLAWPEKLFRVELSTLLNSQADLLTYSDWGQRCEQLLEEAFVGPAPKDDFVAVRSGPDPQASSAFLVRLLRRDLVEAPLRRPRWSERRTGTAPGDLGVDAVARQFVQIIRDLDNRGYFEKVFEKDCPDAPRQVDPSGILETELGVPELWFPTPGRLTSDTDTFYDLIEVLHDLVARPRSRHWHSWNECGWHHSDFSIEGGRALYRWRVNRVLDASSLGLRLANDGEDAGRLVEVTDQARSELAQIMATRTDEASGDRVRHAIALFRSRGANEHDKRSAVVALAAVLEERRPMLKSELFSKDEGALFQIANEFAIRHNRAGQKGDYDPMYLDWVFWWYLATIELTDRMLARRHLKGRLHNVLSVVHRGSSLSASLLRRRRSDDDQVAEV